MRLASVALLLFLTGCSGLFGRRALPPPSGPSLYDAPSPPADEAPPPPDEAALGSFWVEASDPEGTSSAFALAEGVAYEVTIAGTYSVWAPHQWRSVCQGEPDAAPLYPSEGTTGPVALDASFRFAVPSSSRTSCGMSTPAARSGWEFRTLPGADWTMAPTAPAPQPDHTYAYRLVGQGAPLSIRVRDGEDLFGDNYGRLRVTVRGIE